VNVVRTEAALERAGFLVSVNFSASFLSLHSI
jgi:hypothetical protein